jgi:hypothetical protein
MRRLFFSTVAIMVVTLTGLIALSMVFGTEVNAKQAPWRNCPLPAMTKQIELETQHAAWNRAKGLVLREFPRAKFLKSWPRPCMAVRMESLFEGDPDGPGGGLPEGTYQGLHEIPQGPTILKRSGDLLVCEYVYVFLPEGSDPAEVEMTLTHEYLHAIFYRLWNLEPGFRQVFSPQDSEAWVRVLMDDKDWLRENGFIKEGE